MHRKTIRTLLPIFLTVVICSLMIWQEGIFPGRTVQAAALYWGSQGDKVIEVQKKLKQWGYYDGVVDGIYKGQTFEAVKKFQKKNGLKVDGVVGEQTAAAMGVNLGGKKTDAQWAQGGGGNSGDVYLLAKAVHGEARGEPYIGKVAVAAVILNRVKHPSFPNTIAGVIYQPGAFTAVSDAQINLTPDGESIRAARDAMNGWDPSGGAIYYYNPAKSTSKWIFSRPVHTVIGKHRFAT